MASGIKIYQAFRGPLTWISRLKLHSNSFFNIPREHSHAGKGGYFFF